MDLKSYFHNQYQGGESFIEEVIIPIFGEDKYEDAYEEDMLESNPEWIDTAYKTGISKIIRLGKINIPLNTTHVFDITVTDHVQMERNRVAIQLLVRRIMSTYSSAFMIFHYDDTTKWDWRFTFCSKQGKNSDVTDSKRYTFLLGPNQSCRTAAENFMALYKKGGNIELEDIIKAFDVEALSKEFFTKYKEQYEKFCNFVYEHKNDAEYFGSEFATCEEKRIRDYVKKLLGRIVFLHFLQKKGWMGVPVDRDWGEGDLNFMKSLFDNASEAQKEDYLDKMLEPLFEDVNTKRTDDISNCGEFKVPYLNGGLFERDEMDEPKSRFPKDMFAKLFQFFYEYNFTIDENDPNDAQVGVDPEMLGRIFENLLEDNKDKGAFYTPKEIVQYMCKESLIAYLQTDITDEGTKEAVRKFVNTYDASELGNEEFATLLDNKLKYVKICDPAIGSGAFPMGLLKELFLCRGAIEQFDNAAEIKRHIIQNNIYGVDIEKGAVDIARLRFWLALIVDEVTPHALPNMDFKIMQGNSLMEQCKDVNGKYIDLSDLGYNKTKKDQKRGVQLSWFEDAADLSKKQFSIKMNQYFNEDDHAQKVALRKDIKDIVQQQLCDLSYHVDLSNIEDISCTSEFFLWHTWFADVFEKGGFDIVIGNPPYIQLQKDGGYLADLYESRGFNTFERTGDIYCLFYEYGYNLLKERGALCYITSNKWMRTGYGEKTRAFIKDKSNPILLIDFLKMKLFDEATVETNILLLTKEHYKEHTNCAALVELEKSDLSKLIKIIDTNIYPYKFDTDDFWILSDARTGNLKNKIKKAGTPLKSWDLKVNFGVKTGFNDAYIISTEKKDEILAACLSEDERRMTKEIIRPVIRGRDTGVYCNNWADIWIINVHNGLKSRKVVDALPRIDIEDFPSVKSHLNQYMSKLKKRADKGDTFYNLRNCAYLFDFDKPKIIWKRIGSILRFAYDEEKSMCLDSTCFATGKLIKFLTAIFNSKLGHFMLQDSPKTGTGDLLISVQAIEPIVVPIPSNKQKENIEFIVDQILSTKKANPLSDISSLEAEIDRLVYDLYGLTEEEIAIVEGTNS